MLKKILNSIILILFTFSIYGCSSQVNSKKQAKNFEKERGEFKTNLLRKVKSPQQNELGEVPKDVSEVFYKSGDLSLKAWVSKKPTDGDNKKYPAVVFAHGGFAFGEEDWTSIKPYLDAGFVVMTPILRGENDNPGNFEFLYGEVDDIINAGKYLATQDYIDSNRIYLSGHSTGGTVSMLVSLMSSPYSKIASFGGSPDQKFNFKFGWKKYAMFDLKNPKEIELRSPRQYIECVQKPLYIYVGKDDQPYNSLSHKLVEESGKGKEKITLNVMEGDHFTSLDKSIEESIKVFKE